jgi:predicted PurR-regulated permease PerM
MQAALTPWLQDLRAIITRMGSSLFLGVLQFAASIVLAAVFLANGEALGQFIQRLGTRLGGTRAAAFADSAAATIRNVSRGVIGVALAQGALAALGFYVAGVPAAGTLSFLTVGASIVQAPALIILPAILWVWQAEPAMTAILFTAWMLPVMLFDNVVKPIVMGRGLKTPMILILLGVIGGTLTLGLIGLFIGPVVLAVFYDMILLWLEEPEAETEAKAGPKPEAGEAPEAAE